MVISFLVQREIYLMSCRYTEHLKQLLYVYFLMFSDSYSVFDILDILRACFNICFATDDTNIWILLCETTSSLVNALYLVI